MALSYGSHARNQGGLPCKWEGRVLVLKGNFYRAYLVMHAVSRVP